MLSHVARFAAPCAVIALSACAGGSATLRRDVDVLRREVAALQAQNDAMARRLDAMGKALDSAAERAARQPPAPATAAAAPAPDPAGPLVPPNLSVVRVTPPEPIVLRAPPARGGRVAPRLPTAVPVSEPDPERLEELASPAGRELAAEAEVELSAAG